jgi:hypothetical protein
MKAAVTVMLLTLAVGVSSVLADPSAWPQAYAEALRPGIQTNHEGVVAGVTAFLSAWPDNGTAGLQFARANAARIMGRSQAVLGDSAGAVKTWEEVLKFKAQDARTYAAIASCNFYLAARASSRGMPGLAKQHWMDAADPRSSNYRVSADSLGAVATFYRGNPAVRKEVAQRAAECLAARPIKGLDANHDKLLRLLDKAHFSESEYKAFLAKFLYMVEANAQNKDRLAPYLSEYRKLAEMGDITPSTP